MDDTNSSLVSQLTHYELTELYSPPLVEEDNLALLF